MAEWALIKKPIRFTEIKFTVVHLGACQHMQQNNLSPTNSFHQTQTTMRLLT